jgi:hypothetical protein
MGRGLWSVPAEGYVAAVPGQIVPQQQLPHFAYLARARTSLMRMSATAVIGSI